MTTLGGWDDWDDEKSDHIERRLRFGVLSMSFVLQLKLINKCIRKSIHNGIKYSQIINLIMGYYAGYIKTSYNQLQNNIAH